MKKGLSFLICFFVLLGFTSFPAAAGMLQIKGSTTVFPVAQKVAEAFMKEYPEVKISLAGGGSGNGIKALIDGTTDIADSSRFIKEKEVKRAVANGNYPVPFAVAYDCIIPIVHRSNTIEGLTLDQLKAIYKGQIRNWKEVGGENRKILVLSRDTSSGTYEVWESKVMKSERVTPRALLTHNNGSVVEEVSKNKYAIGYIGLGFLNESVKALAVNSVVGSVETTLNGTYAVSRPLYMFTNGWPEGDIDNFMKYMLHPQKGQRLVEEAKFIPLYKCR